MTIDRNPRPAASDEPDLAHPAHLARPAPHPALVNPYAPPAASVSRTAATRAGADGVGASMIALYVALQSIALVLDVAVALRLSRSGGVIPRVGAVVVGLAWLYRRWAALPERPRALGSMAVAPSAAIGLHFLPFVNFFWLFKAQSALRDAVNAAVPESAERFRAPEPPAVLAPLVHLCAWALGAVLYTSPAYLVPLTFSPIAWVVHMALIERAWAHRPKGGVERRAVAGA